MIRRLKCGCADYGILALLGIAFGLAGCGDGKPANPQAADSPACTSRVVKVASTEIKPTSFFAGRIEAMLKVDLRARVDGFLEKRLFTEGSDVKEGDLLFVIEKGPYQAAVDQAKAGIVTAEATLKLADIEVGRQTELVPRNVGAQARAGRGHGQAGRGARQICSPRKPISKRRSSTSVTPTSRLPSPGRIGKANISVGNFVGPNSGTLATIVSQDPIYVTFPVTQREMLAVRKKERRSPADDYTIYLQLADGSRYAQPGKAQLLRRDREPGHRHRAGARDLSQSESHPGRWPARQRRGRELGKGESRLLFPQQALQFDQAGPFVLVVDKDNKVQVRRVETGPASGTNVSIGDKGLNAGELVITEGIQKVRPGQVVQAHRSQSSEA